MKTLVNPSFFTEIAGHFYVRATKLGTTVLLSLSLPLCLYAQTDRSEGTLEWQSPDSHGLVRHPETVSTPGNGVGGVGTRSEPRFSPQRVVVSPAPPSEVAQTSFGSVPSEIPAATPVATPTTTAAAGASVALTDPYQPPQFARRAGFFDGEPLNLGMPGFFQNMLMPPPPLVSETNWFRLEYLGWFNDGFRTPPLVTTSPNTTPLAVAGELGQPGTSVLFGGNRLTEGYQNGLRFKGGRWLDPQKILGIEVDYYQLFRDTDSFSATSNGSTILARPFFDITTGQESAELVAYPGLVRGTVSVEASSRFRSVGISARRSICRPGDPCLTAAFDNSIFGGKTDWLFGYRHARLGDSLSITENLDSFGTVPTGTFLIRDHFGAENRFNGLELGIIHETRLERFWLETLARLAVGRNSQRVNVSGLSDITEGGVRERYLAGIYAQNTNSGNYTKDDIAVLPELGATLGVNITPHISFTLGYTFVYFSNVVRVGDQIDTDLNPNLFPPPASPFSGAERPRLLLRETDFWTHGISFGGDIRF